MDSGSSSGDERSSLVLQEVDAEFEAVVDSDRRTAWSGVGIALGAFAGAGAGALFGNLQIGVVLGSIAGLLIGATAARLIR